MRVRFPGYYDLSPAEKDGLWDQAIVVLDTNVLLDLYRVPEVTRAQLLGMITAWKGRLWIPHQVGVEFYGQRVKTINSAHGKSKSFVSDIQSRFASFKVAVDDVRLDERGHEDVADILIQMDALKDRIVVKASEALSGQLVPGQPDPVLKELEDAIGDSVGEAPVDQAELDRIYKEGAERYACKMGPGFADAGKSNSDLPKYRVGGLMYESQYSDLLIWKQLISYVKASEQKKVLFITKDVKKDWWQIVNGEDRVAPLPELRAEIIREGGVEQFWMYTLEEALERYGMRRGVEVTQAIEDVRSSAESAETESHRLDFQHFSPKSEGSAYWSDAVQIASPQHVAKLINIQVVGDHGYIVAGRSKFNAELGAIIVTAETLDQGPLFLKTIVRRFAEDLRVSSGVKEIYLVVVVPATFTEGDVVGAESQGLSFAYDVGVGVLDRMQVGYVRGNSWRTCNSGKVISDPLYPAPK